MAMMKKVDGALIVADKAADVVKKVFSTEKAMSMGELHTAVGFTAITRTALQQKGVAPDIGAVFRNVQRAIIEAIRIHEEVVAKEACMAPQLPSKDDFDDNLQLEKAVSVVQVVAPSGKGYVAAFLFEPSKDIPGAFRYEVRVAMVDFRIANDWTIVTQSKKSLLRSKSEQRIMELPTAITPERWNAITCCLLGGPVS